MCEAELADHDRLRRAELQKHTQDQEKACEADEQADERLRRYVLWALLESLPCSQHLGDRFPSRDGRNRHENEDENHHAVL